MKKKKKKGCTTTFLSNQTTYQKHPAALHFLMDLCECFSKWDISRHAEKALRLMLIILISVWALHYLHPSIHPTVI